VLAGANGSNIASPAHIIHANNAGNRHDCWFSNR
jgi:hypothetical protein